jgi:hypothetical protein
MHLSPEEQLRRYKSRRDDPYRSWKLTEEDWRNREKRPGYEAAVEDMLELTDHPAGRWYVVAAEDKRSAREAVVRTVCDEDREGARGARCRRRPAVDDGLTGALDPVRATRLCELSRSGPAALDRPEAWSTIGTAPSRDGREENRPERQRHRQGEDAERGREQPPAGHAARAWPSSASLRLAGSASAPRRATMNGSRLAGVKGGDGGNRDCRHQTWCGSVHRARWPWATIGFRRACGGRLVVGVNGSAVNCRVTAETPCLHPGVVADDR